MTLLDNVTPTEPTPTAAPANSSLRFPRKRNAADAQSLVSSVSSLPFRKPNNSVSSLFASTSTPPGSRSISPNGGRALPKVLAGSVFAGNTTPGDIIDSSLSDQHEDPRYLILHAYVPHIAVYTSADTDEVVADKGFPQGLWELLRPFGERVQGKVTIRDSNGANRIYDDFAVRFVQLGDGLGHLSKPNRVRRSTDGQAGGINGNSVPRAPEFSKDLQAVRTGGDIEAIEGVVDRHLSYAEDFPLFHMDNLKSLQSSLQLKDLSPFYALYLRRLLSGIPLTPHETFSHPVACIIAISSRNPSPIEALRHLYDVSSRGEKRLPLWVNSEYLRYYILVHDEERDDISKSIALFEQMKRHFGLHCHLLRLRSSQCVPTDDDSTELLPSEWRSASEELAEIEAKELEEDVEGASPYIFESDALAIRTFIREMVTQSVIPSMERCISTWNEQVASRRRGISGRLSTLTKKWTGFGSNSRNSSMSGTPGAAAGSNSNYDSVLGFYRPEVPEAIMRKLADYAFMLRDWKLAHSVYDLLRADYNNDKAWEYHGAANEMAALSALLLPQGTGSKTRLETVDQMLETAAYSYLSRCRDSYSTARCLILGMELLRLRGGSSTDDAARWGSRLLESKTLGAVGEALVNERIAVCYASREGVGSGGWGSRLRKAALWNILAADEWLAQGKYGQATRRVADARVLYEKLGNPESLLYFHSANAFLSSLERELQATCFPRANVDGQVPIENEDTMSMDEESEALDTRSHRKSLIGASAPPLFSLETASLRSSAADEDASFARDDNFV